MKLIKRLALIFLTILVLVIVLIWLAGRNKSEGGKNMPNVNTLTSTASGLQLVSQVFRDGASIPTQYSCNDQNVNPPLNIMSVPANAKSLALIMHDPDAPSGDFVHWLMWDIPTSTETIAVNKVPQGAVQGVNSSGQNKYMGPCPPSGTHHYKFDLYALDTTLNLSSGTNRSELVKAMQGHIVEQHTLTGTFSAQ